MQSQTMQQLPETSSTSEVEPNIRVMPTTQPSTTIDQQTNPNDLLKQLEQVSRNCKEAAKQHQQAKKEMVKLAQEQKKQLKKQEQELKVKSDQLKKQQEQTDRLSSVKGQPLSKKENFYNMTDLSNMSHGDYTVLLLFTLLVVAIVYAIYHLYKYKKLKHELLQNGVLQLDQRLRKQE